jgi:polyphosphate kinase
MIIKDPVNIKMGGQQKVSTNYISRDLSWVKFNYRVLDQCRNASRNVFDRLKFLAITSSNLDEFFQIRVGSLYNYIDYGKERIDYSGLRETAFKKVLFTDIQEFCKEQQVIFNDQLKPEFEKNHFQIINAENQLSQAENELVGAYFKKTIFPMLTPMTYDNHHSFPIMMNKLMVFGVVSINRNIIGEQKRLTLVQIPQNLPRFFQIQRDDHILFIPVQEIIRWNIQKLFRNVELLSVNLFRIIRNGDFSVEESDDIDEAFIDEIKKKIKTRRTARVVRIEVEENYSSWMMKILLDRYLLDESDIFVNFSLMDFTCLWQIVNHPDFKEFQHKLPPPVNPLAFPTIDESFDLLKYLKKNDVFLHHPFNDFRYVVELLEQAAEDPGVLAIKITIYRLAKNSRITNALLKAAENGKHVSVLFEVTARFDEENNIKEAQRLQKAGCFVIYGLNRYKTHTKLMLIVRKNQDDSITRYVHLSSGNYNEDTARLYTDISLLTTNEIYAQDISEFFNVITGHSEPGDYQYLITAPRDIRRKLIELIEQEAANAKAGLKSGIAIKINSLQDKDAIDALYRASQAGVPIQLIVRGMCCLRPGQPDLSDNITVRSIVGNLLEHNRLYYFHNNGDSKVYGGSADMMVRSFDRRIESLFLIVDKLSKQIAIEILKLNLLDNVNSYTLNNDDMYVKNMPAEGDPIVDIHKDFFKLEKKTVLKARLFD